MQEVLHFLHQLNVPTILAVIGASWFFSRKTREDVKEIKQEIKSIHKEFKFINIRLSRVEGTVYGKDIYKIDTAENSSTS